MKITRDRRIEREDFRKSYVAASLTRGNSTHSPTYSFPTDIFEHLHGLGVLESEWRIKPLERLDRILLGDGLDLVGVIGVETLEDGSQHLADHVNHLKEDVSIDGRLSFTVKRRFTAPAFREVPYMQHTISQVCS